VKFSGLYHVIYDMYNGDIRRISEALRQVIGLPINADLVLSEYVRWWDYSRSRGISMTERTAIRYLCRKSVLRVFYNLFAHQGLFDRLGVGKTLQIEEKSSYARKILTYLYQKNKKKK